MLLSHLSKLVSEIKKTFTKYSQDPGLANHRYISILRNEALKNEPGLLSIFEIEHVVHVGRSFIEQIDIKDPMMISLMELWISGIYEQNELIDTLFLI